MDPNASAAATQAVVQAILTLLNTPWTAVLQYLALGLVGLVLIPTVKQHVIELIIAKFNPPVWARFLLPMGLAGFLGVLAKALGADTDTAMSAAGVWATMTHIVNESPLALSLANKLPAGALDEIKKAAAAASGAAAVLALCLLLPAAAKAESWNVNVGLMTGVNNSVFSDGGALKPITGALAGGEVSLGYGFQAEDGGFDPEIVPLLTEVSLDTRSGSQWLNAGVGFGFVIPATKEPVTLMVNWDLGSGQALPYIAAGYTLSFRGLNLPVNWKK